MRKWPIANREEEARDSEDAGNFGFLEADTGEAGTMPEETLVEEGEPTMEEDNEAVGNSTGKDTTKKRVYEEPLAPSKKPRVLQKAASGDQVRPSSSSGKVTDKKVADKAS